MFNPGATRVLLFSILNIFCICGFAAGTSETLSPERIGQIASMLPEKPRGPGKPISDREFWQKFAGEVGGTTIVRSAERITSRPIPPQPDELYLEYTRTGNRTHWQDVAKSRRSPIEELVLAECIENRGRFLPAIADRITTLCAERTWVLPAHDRDLQNFKGTTITIDLGSSALGLNLAMADYLVGDKLDPAVKQQLRARLQERILKPYSDMIHDRRPKDWWITGTNNWNSVCHAGVIGAALIECESREQRAEYVAAAEHFSDYFLSGFTPDGYCSEGLGYWNYGFGHFALLSELVRDATSGKIDLLLGKPAATAPAKFGSRIQIINGVAPAFADCPISAQPATGLMWLLNRRFQWGLQEYQQLDRRSMVGPLAQGMIYGRIAEEPVANINGGAVIAHEQLRTWFKDAGILIGRPVPGSGCNFGVALKGGNNAENHNHNDLGSYVVVVGNNAVLLDPGSETYTARTFSSHRYDSKLLNSYGHAVPVVAGKLQRPGANAVVKVVETQFTENEDHLVLDISSAYTVPELKKLERTFVYSRQGHGSLEVRDDVEFSSPQTFGTAMITLGKVEKTADGQIEVTDGDSTVHTRIRSSIGSVKTSTEEIHENAPVKPTRIAIDLPEPVTSATILIKISAD